MRSNLSISPYVVFTAVLPAASVFLAALSAECRSRDEVSAVMHVSSLHCEYRDRPLGIDHPQPRLSWVLESDVRGAKQGAYRIVVSSTESALDAGRGDLWDSGKVISDQSVGVVYAGKALGSGQRCFWKVKVWPALPIRRSVNPGGSGIEEKTEGAESEWSTTSFWEMGLLSEGDWNAEWISDGKPLPEQDAGFYRDDPAPLFRKPFRLSAPVKTARLYISALGYYRASLNGEIVGDHLLDPLWTRPDKRVFYSVYDVTEKLSAGSNCLGVTLGNGWYNPLPLRMWGRVNLRERIPVGRPQFIARLNIDYADGTSESLVSDRSWRVTEGPILRNNIYLGEKVDARKAVPGWDKPGLDDGDWATAHSAPAPAGALQAQPLPRSR